MNAKLDRKSLLIGFAIGILPALAVVLIWGPGRSELPDLRALRENLPEAPSALTPYQTANKLPRYYEFGTGPGKRVWRRSNNDTWHEEYPDGYASVFKVLGHGKVGDTEGTIVAKVSGHSTVTGTANDGTLQTFIPDKGNERMHHLCRDTSRGVMQWYDCGEMQEVQ